MIVFDAPRIGKWVCERTGGQWIDGIGTAIGLEKDGELIAGVMYDNFNGKSVAMHVAGVGKRWMTKEYLRICFDYPFNQLKVSKIIGLVDSENSQALQFDAHLGFIEEAVIQGAAPKGDLHILTMTRAQCRWLKE